MRGCLRWSIYFFAARGSFAPSARSILAMTALLGMALPDSYSLITCGCMFSCCAGRCAAVADAAPSKPTKEPVEPVVSLRELSETAANTAQRAAAPGAPAVEEISSQAFSELRSPQESVRQHQKERRFLEAYLEKKRQQQMLRNAGNRILKPKLMQGVQLTEGVSVQEQLREMLTKNAVRVIDLLRSWDGAAQSA